MNRLIDTSQTARRDRIMAVETVHRHCTLESFALAIDSKRSRPPGYWNASGRLGA